MASNWQETYEKLKKKNEALNRIQGNDIVSTLPKKSASTTSSKKKDEDEERTWFSSGLFDDGYDIGDISKTILGTTTDLYKNAVQGAIGIGEKGIDFGATLLGGAGKLIGADNFADNMQDFVEKDLIDEEKLANRATNTGSVLGWTNNLLNGNMSALNPFGEDATKDKGIGDNSIFGEKSDSLIQSGGQLAATMALQAVGVPWWLTTGATSFGAEAEQAFKQDATYGEAIGSALISAGAEVLLEKLSGGISFGGKTLDIGLKSKIAQGITNKTLQTLTKFGIDVVGEGTEEVLTEVLSNVGKKLTYEDEKTWEEMLTSEEAMDSYLESFIGGAVLGGTFSVGRVNSSLKTGRDYDTGLSENEQKVIDAEIAKRTEGQQLTSKQKAKIEAEVREDLEKGYITTDTIESTLGGKTYNQLKSVRDHKTNLETQIKELENKPNAEITVKEMEQLNSLREQLEQSNTNTLETKLQSEMSNLIKSDGYLQRSYQEKAKRSKEFTYEVAETDSEFRKGVLESTKGKLNDTTRSHETAEALVKLSEDRKMQYKFTNTKELQQMKLVPEGKTANGLYVVEKDGKREILVNTDSKKYIEAVLVHETAHDFQTTSPETYTKLQDITKQFAEASGDYARIHSEVTEMYKNVEGVNIEEEVTSRLLEDYLGNKDFISNLTTKEPNIVKKIIDEIKYLVKKFTAGSPEARKLVELQHKLEETYKEAYRKTEATETTEGTKYSLTDNSGRELTKGQQEYFKDSKARDDDGNLTTVYHTTPKAGFTVFEGSKGQGNYKFGEYGEGIAYFTDSKDMSESYSRNSEDAGTYEGYVNITNPYVVDAEGRFWSRVTREYVQETYEKYKSLNEIERDYLMDLATWDDARLFASTIKDAHQWVNIEHKTDIGEDNVALASAYKKLEGVDLYDLYDVATEDFSDESMKKNSIINLSTNEVVKKALKDGSYDGVIIKNVIDYGSGTSEVPANVYVTFSSEQFKSYDNTNPTTDKDIRYSLDNQGRELSEGQIEYFKDSKVRDENESLVTVYHTMTNAGTQFNEFNPVGTVGYRFGDQVVNYYTDSKDMSGSYAGQRYNMADTKKLNSIEDAKKWLEDRRFRTNLKFDYELKQNPDGSYKLDLYEFDDGYRIGGAEFGNENSLLRNLKTEVEELDYSKEHFKYQYEGYVNITNPYVVDADGRNWSSVQSGIDSKIQEQLNRITDSEKKALSQLANESVSKHKELWNEETEDKYRLYKRTYSTLTTAEKSDIDYKVKLTNPDKEIYLEGWIGDSHYQYTETLQDFANTYNQLVEDYSTYSNERSYFTKNYKDMINTNKIEDITSMELFDIAYQDFREAFYEEVFSKDFTTNDIVHQVIEMNKNGSNYDGVIIKNVVDYGGHTDLGQTPNNLYITFSSEQFKAWDNENPTADKDFRYSLSEDSKGNEINPIVLKRFENSKVRDENGNLKVVYHGTPNGEFTIFDKSKGSVEGDFGSGFYFTDNEYDVETNYEGGGPDFDNKVERLAERIYEESVDTEQEISYEEAKQQAKEQLYKGSYKFEVYLNIENPAIVGETYLLSQDDYLERYNQEDYDNEDDYYADVEQAFADDVESIIWEVESNVDVYSTDGLADILYEAYYNGGIQVQELKENINNLYLESNDGELVGNEVTRQVIESLGYDGIIDPTVANKFIGMNIEEGTTHYIAFKPNQIKAITNQNPTENDDINLSLSNESDIAPTSTRNQTAAQDIKLQEIAPTKETVQTEQQTTPMNTTDIDYAPASQEVVEQQSREAFNTLYDADLPQQVEDFAPIGEQVTPTDSLFDTRDYEEVGSKKVNAYQFDNPEVKPYFQTAAREMLTDLQNSTRGERFIIGDNSQLGDNDYYYSGTKRATTDDIAELLDGMGGKYKYSYAEIEKGLRAIIEDNGAENNAVSKRIEFYLDKRLREGYTDIDGYKIPADAEYLDVLRAKGITDYYNSIPLDEAPVIDKPNVSNSNIAERIAPIKAEAIRPAPDKDTHGYRLVRVKTDAEIQAETNEEIAEVLAEEPKTENTRNKRKWAIIKANVLDKGMVFEDVSLKHKNRELMGKWDYTLTSEARGQNVIGNGHYEYDPYSKTTKKVSKSLNEIREQVESTGLTKEFYEYMYHKHNIDRMRLDKTHGIENKPVFGYNVTADQSVQKVRELENLYPDFMLYAQDVYDYLEADRNVLVENGVISEETAQLWKDMYPHYVPIRRAGHTGNAINVPLDTGRTGVNAPIKKATGGNQDILPLFDTMASRTLQTHRAAAKNSFGVELKNTIGTTINSQATNIDEVIDSVDAQEELLQEGKKGQKPTFTVFEDGEKITFEITQDMYDALKPISDSSILSKTITPLNAASSFHRGVLTQYNPVFMLTNGIKDAQDILINSQHSAKTYAKVPEAFAQLISKGYWYQEYMLNGGEHNSYFDSVDNTFKTENKGLKKILDLPPLKQIAQMNDYIERIPRLAEYIASREAGRSVEVSMLDAARVTTNFKAGGNLTKFLNRNGVTFLNASVQGAMQQVRNIREANANGVRGWANLATKFAIAGLPAMILNALLWEDDEEYEELSDYVKQNYYIVAKNDDGTFIRIPKGRTVAVIQEGVRQMKNLVTGEDEADLKTFIDLFLTNLAPNSPVDNNILSPIADVLKNETWYDEDLVPTRLQNLPAAEQYDESTDSFSRWLGEKTNFSPMKINYLLDQYTGGVGDVVLPMLTPEAKSDADTLGEQLLAPLKSKFTTNAVMNNQNVSDFYDKSEELTTNAKKSTATDEDVLRNKYINSVKAEMNELYAEKREIQNSDLSNSEKYNRVLEVQKQINELSKEALNDYKNVDIYSNYATAGDRQYRLTDDGEWQKINDKQLEKQDEVTSTLGITPNDYWSNKEEYDYAYENPSKYALANAIADYSTFRQLSSELYDIKADKDSDGKSISGSRKEKVFDYINNLNLDFEQRIMLAKLEYPSYDEYNYEIIEYLNEREDISREQMVSILTELGFTVKPDGTIVWD